jgi:hypothetical protein
LDGGDGLHYLRAEPYTQLDQLGPFRRSYCDSSRALIAQNPVLGLEVLDGLHQLFFRRLGQEQQQGVNESLHGSTMRKFFADLEGAY